MTNNPPLNPRLVVAIGFPRFARDDSSSLRSESKLIFNLKTTADPSRASALVMTKKSKSPLKPEAGLNGAPVNEQGALVMTTKSKIL